MIDRTQPPIAEPLEIGPSFPPPHTEEIAPGRWLWFYRQQHTRLAYVSMSLRSGARSEPRGREGLSSFSAALLDEGTQGFTSAELAHEVESLGATLFASAAWSHLTGGVELLQDDLARGLQLLREVLYRPTFPTEEVERQRRRRLAELARRVTEPGSLAATAFSEATYAGHRYGLPLFGTVESLSTMDQAELIARHDEALASERAHVVMVADLEPAAARTLAEELFEPAPPPRRQAAQSEARPSPKNARRVVIVDRPESEQTELRIGHASIDPLDSRRPTLAILNSIVGGKFMSRINLNLREERGLTYGASSRFVMRSGGGPFLVGTAISSENVGEGVEQILLELERLRTEPVPDAELRDARDYLLGTFPYSLQTLQAVAGRISHQASHDLTPGFWNDWLRGVADATSATVLEAARETLAPDEAVIVAVGPAESLRGQLTPFGEIEVREPESVPRA